MAGWTSLNLRFVNINTILVFIVYSLNFLLLVGAIVTIYICLSEQRQKDIIENIDINFEFLVFFSKTLLIVAIIVALVTLLGCVGVAIDNDYMLIAYIIIIGVLMASQIFLSTYISNKLVSSEKDVGEKILKVIKSYASENAKKLDGFQTKYQCCGIESYKDWLDTQKGGIGQIPGTCCNKRSNETCAQDTVYGVKGCKKAIMEEISSMLKQSIVIIFVIFFLEVLLAVCSILVIMDIGQPSEDNTSDEIVVVASLKKKLSPNRENRKFEESIDTHDSHHAQPESIQSPVAKMDEINGLYDEEKIIQRTQDHELEDEESHENGNDTVGKSNKTTSKENEDDTHDADEEIITGDASKDEVTDEENPEDEAHDDEGEKVDESENPQVQTKKAADEEIYLEGNLETKDHQGETNTEKQINKKKEEKTKYIKKRNTSVKMKAESTLRRVKTVQKKQEEKDEEEEGAEEEVEDERLATVNQTKLEENIHVSKSKRFGKKKYGEKKVQKERIRDRRRFK